MEIEDKFDVPAGFEVPDLTGLPGVTGAAGPVTHRLAAVYFDTPDLRLAARGVTLRRRRGGTDAGWHLKLPKAGGARQEIARPLGRSAKTVPADLADLVLAFTRGAPLAPVAELETRRTVTTLVNGAGVRLVEIADDQVTGSVPEAVAGGEPGSGPHVERWREVEAELVGGDERLLRKVGKRLAAAGAVPAASPSKLVRVLGSARPIPGRPRPRTRPGSAGEVVTGYLTAQADALLAQDPRVRRADDDAVHRMRVAARRLRSALRSFGGVVEDTAGLQEELKWLGRVLGEARDAEVVRERLIAGFDALGEGAVSGPVRLRLDAELGAAEREALDRAREALRGERYFALLDALDALTAAPALTGAADRPAKTLRALAAKSWRRVVKAHRAALAVTDPAGREHAMHDVRKAAKRARYTAEAIGMDELAGRAEAVQEALGARMDGVVAQGRLAAVADAARRAGEDTFTYGVLTGLERARTERAREEFPRLWKKTSKAVAKLL